MKFVLCIYYRSVEDGDKAMSVGLSSMCTTLSGNNISPSFL